MADTGGRLTTHVLDTMHGKPAAGMRYELSLMHGDHGHAILSGTTNADGRCEEPLLGGERWGQGDFVLSFHVGDYFAAQGVEAANGFLTVVPIRFTISEDAPYHVPLLVSPFAYSTYRGS
jgi:5-hydroxyisourate hydrolase